MFLAGVQTPRFNETNYENLSDGFHGLMQTYGLWIHSMFHENIWMIYAIVFVIWILFISILFVVFHLRADSPGEIAIWSVMFIVLIVAEIFTALSLNTVGNVTTTTVEKLESETSLKSLTNNHKQPENVFINLDTNDPSSFDYIANNEDGSLNINKDRLSDNVLLFETGTENPVRKESNVFTVYSGDDGARYYVYKNNKMVYNVPQGTVATDFEVTTR